MAGLPMYGFPSGTVGPTKGLDLSPFFNAWQLQQQAMLEESRRRQQAEQFARSMAFQQRQQTERGQLATLEAGQNQQRIDLQKQEQEQKGQAQQAEIEQGKANIALRGREQDFREQQATAQKQEKAAMEVKTAEEKKQADQLTEFATSFYAELPARAEALRQTLVGSVDDTGNPTPATNEQVRARMLTEVAQSDMTPNEKREAIAAINQWAKEAEGAEAAEFKRGEARTKADIDRETKRATIAIRQNEEARKRETDIQKAVLDSTKTERAEKAKLTNRIGQIEDRMANVQAMRDKAMQDAQRFAEAGDQQKEADAMNTVAIYDNLLTAAKSSQQQHKAALDKLEAAIAQKEAETRNRLESGIPKPQTATPQEATPVL